MMIDILLEISILIHFLFTVSDASEVARRQVLLFNTRKMLESAQPPSNPNDTRYIITTTTIENILFNKTYEYKVGISQA